MNKFIVTVQRVNGDNGWVQSTHVQVIRPSYNSDDANLDRIIEAINEVEAELR